MSVSIISSYVTCITLPTFFFQYNCTFLISKHNFVICTWFHDYIWMAMNYFCAWLYRFFSLIVLSNKVAGFKRGCQTFNNIHGGVFVVCYFDGSTIERWYGRDTVEAIGLNFFQVSINESRILNLYYTFFFRTPFYHYTWNHIKRTDEQTSTQTEKLHGQTQGADKITWT